MFKAGNLIFSQNQSGKYSTIGIFCQRFIWHLFRSFTCQIPAAPIFDQIFSHFCAPTRKYGLQNETNTNCKRCQTLTYYLTKCALTSVLKQEVKAAKMPPVFPTPTFVLSKNIFPKFPSVGKEMTPESFVKTAITLVTSLCHSCHFAVIFCCGRI